MNIPLYSVILLLLTFNVNLICGVEIVTAFVVFKSVLKILDVAVDLYDEFSNDSMPQTPKEEKLYQAMANITALIENVERNVPQVTIAKMKQLERDFSKIIHFEIKLDDLVRNINNIESKYDSFLKLRPKIKSKIDNSTSPAKAAAIEFVLTDFANSVITFASGSVQNSLSSINDMIVVRESSSLYTKDIFSLFLDNFNTNTESRCLINKSPQQLIFDIHTSLRVVQLKAEILFEFSYMILHLYGKGDFKDELTSFHKDMRSRYNEQNNVANSVMSTADNAFWRCDPNKHVAEQTYTEFKHLIQGYIHNEKELNQKRNCFDGCNYYEYTSHPYCDNSDPLCTIQASCKGRVFDCKFVTEDMSICYANSTSSRRYDWVQYAKGGPTYGHKERGCSYLPHWVEGYRKYLFWRCQYCFCLCDEETSASERYVSLEPTVSDVANNKIVVGLQFVKKDKVLYVQIREATLLAGGAVDNKTLSWVPVPTIRVNSWLDRPKFHKLNYESRGFDLDDLVAPPKYLVTGVRFRTIGAHLNLEVQFTGFNFETGRLYTNLSYWKGNDNTDVTPGNARSRFVLSSTVPPIDSPDANIPDSVSDSFLEFVPSDERTDAAQSTVPFIDIQQVIPNPPVPLVGVGIIHKGSFTNAGFVEPKVFTLNVGKMLSGAV